MQSSHGRTLIIHRPDAEVCFADTLDVLPSPPQELVQGYGRTLDPEVEAIVPALAKKAGEMSNAGRETFLAQEASNVLSAMTELLSVSRVRLVT